MFSWPDHEEILRYSRIYAGLFAVTALVSGLVTFLQAWLFGLAGTKLTDRLRVLTFNNYLVQVRILTEYILPVSINSQRFLEER